MEKIMLHPRAMMMVLPHCSTDESRARLQGVFLKGGGAAIATNGHTLGAHRLAHDGLDDMVVTFPKSSMRLFKKAAGHDNGVILDLDARTISVEFVDDLFHVKISDPKDANYPNFKEVLPPKSAFKPVKYISFQTKLFSLFSERLVVYFTQPDGAIVIRDYYDEDFYGLVMPLSAEDKEPPGPPWWLTGKPEPEPAKKPITESE